MTEKKGGVRCPVCGTHLSNVKESRSHAGFIRRRRMCFNEHPFTTEERVVGVHRREAVRAKALALMQQQQSLPQRSRLSMQKMAEQLLVSKETLYRIKRGDVAERQAKRKPSKEKAS